MDHRVCSPGRDWIHGVTLKRDGNGNLKFEPSPSTFHPNAYGQAGFARVIASASRDVFR
jgi:hypothetical protein